MISNLTYLELLFKMYKMYKKLFIFYKKAVKSNIIFLLSPSTLYGYLNKTVSIIIIIIIIIIKILDIIFIIVLRVNLLLMIWSRVNIVFYLFRYFFLLFTPRVVQHVPYLWMMCTNNARFALLFYTRSITGYVAVLSRCLSKIDLESFVAYARSFAK